MGVAHRQVGAAAEVSGKVLELRTVTIIRQVLCLFFP